MNKNFLNAVAVSLAVHASAFSMEKEGKFFQILMPVDEIAHYQEKQSAVGFTFVESPANQLADEQPSQKTNLISDKSTAAKSPVKGASSSPVEAPYVDKVSAGKQVGQLVGTPPVPAPSRAPSPQPVAKSSRPMAKPAIMKAQKVEETPDAKMAEKAGEIASSPPSADRNDKVPPSDDEAASDQQDEKLKDQYMVRIKELQEKMEKTSQQIKENEKILEAQKQQRERAQPEEEKPPQDRSQDQEGGDAGASRGIVGLGGASLHQTTSDVQGDVERFGEICFNANRYELGAYFKKLKTKVEEYWLPYLAFTYSGNNLFGNKTVVFFKIMPDGKVADVKVLEHEGDELLRDFCISSVQNTSPFDPLPESFLNKTGYPYLPIVFTFNY